MLNLPKQYEVNKKFALKTFIPKELKPGEKKRLKEALKEVRLIHQITGEGIPSLIDEAHNCSVIMFFDVKIEKVKDASFVSGILQTLIKSPCILRIYDDASEVYSFAHKRLNLQDSNEIVIEETIITKPFSTIVQNDKKNMLEEYLSFEKIVNTNNKLAFYAEIMGKSYIVSNPAVFSKAIQLLKSKFWYNLNEIWAILSKLKRLESLITEQIKTSRASDKVKLNTEMKNLIQELESLI
ncbi:MAG: DUF4391 domain-containing protein [Candidatus Gastranaerophilales bacterium]|nr:DUF4391 domain-containing protein [Candidatus Gastranaerophilales bacterium]